MANETTRSTADDIILNAEINARAIDAARAAGIMPSLVYVKKAANPDSAPISVTFPKWPKLSMSSLSEASDLSNTAVSTGGVTVTAATAGLMIKPTDVVRITSTIGLADDVTWQRQLGLAAADYIDATLAALLGGFSNTVGVSGSDLTLAQFLTAIYTLDDNNAPNGNATDPEVFGGIPAGLQGKIAVLAPIQVADLRTAVSSSSATMFADMDGANIVRQDGSRPRGYEGTLFGVPIFQSTNVPTANTNADRAGAIFVPSALGLYVIYEAKYEAQRDASMLATELVGSTFFGAGELVDTYGVSVITDA